MRSTQKSQAGYQFASLRLGVILNSYTVYLDLVLSDMDGNIVANGRPEQYRSIGQRVDDQEWLCSATKTRSGEEFGFQSAHRSQLVNNQPVLIYSCGVREGGSATGKLIGVLGIIFNWEALAQTIMKSVPLSAAEKKVTRCCIIDAKGNILADSMERHLTDSIDVRAFEPVFQQKKAFFVTDYQGQECCAAHARAPGFRNLYHRLVFADHPTYERVVLYIEAQLTPLRPLRPREARPAVRRAGSCSRTFRSSPP